MTSDPDHELPGSLARDELAKWMHAHGIPVTRENYITYCYLAADVWNEDYESLMPVELQDWSKVRS
jgi:hypothetical protein